MADRILMRHVGEILQTVNQSMRVGECNSLLSLTFKVQWFFNDSTGQHKEREM